MILLARDTEDTCELLITRNIVPTGSISYTALLHLEYFRSESPTNCLNSMRRRSLDLDNSGDTRRTLSRKSSNLGKTHPSSYTQIFRTVVMRWRVLTVRRRLLFIIGVCLTSFSLYATLVGMNSKLQQSGLTMHPRVILIDEKFKIRSIYTTDINPAQRNVEPLSERTKFKEDAPLITFEKGDCEAMHDWQLSYQPACNSIHEIDMYNNKFLAEGGFRSVWLMPDGDGSEAVIKTLVWRKKFRGREKDRHRRDAATYMMLQGSQHIPKIHGYCK